MYTKGKIEASKSTSKATDRSVRSTRESKAESKAQSECPLHMSSTWHTSTVNLESSDATGTRSTYGYSELMLERNSPFALVLLSLSISSSIASTGESGFRTLRRTQILLRSSRGISSSSFLVPRALDVDGGEYALIDQLALEDDFGVAGAFEFFEDHVVHAGAGVDQSGGDDGERAAFFDVAG